MNITRSKLQSLRHIQKIEIKWRQNRVKCRRRLMSLQWFTLLKLLVLFNYLILFNYFKQYKICEAYLYRISAKLDKKFAVSEICFLASQTNEVCTRALTYFRLLIKKHDRNFCEGRNGKRMENALFGNMPGFT